MDKAESVDPKVEYSDSKSLVEKQSFRKTKIVAIAVLAVVLLLGAVISMTLFFTLNQRRTPTPDRFTEVNLQEGETLTYRVDQKLELHEMYFPLVFQVISRSCFVSHLPHPLLCILFYIHVLIRLLLVLILFTVP